VLDQGSRVHPPQCIVRTRPDTGWAAELLDAEIAFGSLEDGPAVVVDDCIARPI
jgi:hypothetical protein